MTEYAVLVSGYSTHLVAGKVDGVPQTMCGRWMNLKMICEIIEEPTLPMCQVCLHAERIENERMQEEEGQG